MRLLALLMLPVCGLAQTVAVTSAVDHQVLQRDARDQAVLALKGTAEGAAGKSVEARVVARKGGTGWKSLGRVDGGAWSGELTLSTGGPYRVEVRAAGGPAAAVNDILVGDLWVLAGQSNMEGVGNLENVQPPNPLVHSFDQTDHWDVAREPLHRLADAVDRVHWRRNPQTREPEKLQGEALQEFIAKRKKGAGLGLPFAVQMLERTGVPVGLVPCAHGGTSMDQWDPSLKEQGGDSLYGATVRRVKLLGGKVKGILWYQGESDANPKAAPEFLAKFERLVASFRADFGQPDLPFYYVQLGRHVNNSNVGEWNSVQESQRLAEQRIAKSGMIPAVDTALDDGIHVGTPDLKRLGARLANMACHDLFPNVPSCAALHSGPRPLSAAVDGEGRIRVTYTGVNGGLKADGRLWGFTIHNAAGEYFPAIYRAALDPADPSAVILHYGGKLPDGATLRYCAGKDSFCNLTDGAGMGAPVFGPLPIAAAAK